MGMLTKVMVVVNLVLALGVAALTFALWAKQVNWVKEAESATNKFNEVQVKFDALQKERDQLRRTANEQLTAAAAELKTVTGRADSLTSENADLKKRLGERETTIQTSNNTLAANTRLLAEHKQTIDGLRADVDRLRKEANESRQVTEKAKSAVVSIAADLQAANGQTKALMEQRNILMNRVDALERQLQRYTEVLPDLPVGLPGQTGPNVEGLIQQVDHESGLLVVKVGESSGVRKGMEFTLSRGDKYLGKGRVVRIGPDFAIMNLSDMTPDRQDIQVGDVARTLY